MPEHRPSSAEQLAARVTDLENRYTLLQRLVEELDQVLVAQGRQIESLERKAGLLTNQLSSLIDREAEPRTLEDEKPPHY